MTGLLAPQSLQRGKKIKNLYILQTGPNYSNHHKNRLPYFLVYTGKHKDRDLFGFFQYQQRVYPAIFVQKRFVNKWPRVVEML
ncbi:uncharacterized protein METZ01_LOCUS75542 [marine metagenome]|uniref:Uncharacterized protein n=1 Tax=marine metagenome TaxID=408172 RepID=A0A381U525_9ZZZZ